MEVFNPSEIKKLYKPDPSADKGESGQVTIIGGSKLFHGAALFSLKVASRVVDMVFFASPEPSVGNVANQFKSKLFSFIWVPMDDLDKYIEKSDAVLIGPGMMRFDSESHNPGLKTLTSFDGEGRKTREITEKLLKKFPNKKWVIDGGSLQTMDAAWIPAGSVITPNKKEFSILFGEHHSETEASLKSLAQNYHCTIVLKGVETLVATENGVTVVRGGNAGLAKGGSGDALAGLLVALLAKNDAYLASTSASYLVKKAADELYKSVGTNFNSDDIVNKLPQVLFELEN